MPNISIRVENLSKQYRIGAHTARYHTLRDTLTDGAKGLWRRITFCGSPDEQPTFWALKNVSFSINEGEVVGIIGRNGAGKTTILKVLSRITDPTEGSAEIHGRVASLLEVGTGFHPELTGRDNVYLNGAILGMRREEIDAKFDEIVAFSEVERFIDTPVKHFSSGMYMRLAFAVAAHLMAEILIVDEVLAVGDLNFQKKCLGKMEDVARQGRTVLFVSHNMTAVQRLCSRVIWLDAGSVHIDGPTRTVVSRYIGADAAAQAEKMWGPQDKAPGDSVARLRAVRARRHSGSVSGEYSIHEPINVEIEFEVLIDHAILESNIYLISEDGLTVFVSNAENGNPWRSQPRQKGVYRETCTVPGDFLNEGRFTIHAGVTTPPWTVRGIAKDIVAFKVADDYQGGARGAYTREWPASVVRPMLRWTSEFEPATQVEIDAHRRIT